MYKYDGNKNYVFFSLAFLGIPPNFKIVITNLNATNNMSPRSWAWDEVGQRELWDILELFSKYDHVITNVARKERKWKSVIDKDAHNHENGNGHLGEQRSEDYIML